MYKKLIFSAQEVIAGRFDGDQYMVREMVDKQYKPDLVKLDHYYPENDPNAYILQADLDSDGKDEVIVIRTYRWDGDVDALPDTAQISIDGEVYFHFYGETVQPKIFTVDIDITDNMIEFAFVFTREDGNSFIRLYCYDDRYVTVIGGIWGKLDSEFTGSGRIAEFPGDGSIITYIPDDAGFRREVVYPEKMHGTWIGGTYFY